MLLVSLRILLATLQKMKCLAPICYQAFWLLLAWGVAVIARRWRGVGAALGVALLALTLLSLLDYSWYIQSYQSKARYFHRLDYSIGEWLARNTSPTCRVALYQAGGIKFFSDRYVIDGGGVTEHTIWQYLKRGTFAQAIIDRKADYVASFGDEWLAPEGVSMNDTRFFRRVDLPCRGLFEVVNRDGLATYLREQYRQRNLTPPPADSR